MKISDDKMPLAPMQEFFAHGWRDDDVPEDGAVIEACAEDHRGRYAIPFPVKFLGDEWLNAATGERLECFIAGWRAR